MKGKKHNVKGYYRKKPHSSKRIWVKGHAKRKPRK